VVVPVAHIAAPHRRDNVQLTDTEKARAERRTRTTAVSHPQLPLRKVHDPRIESVVGSPGGAEFASPNTVKRGAQMSNSPRARVRS
jgi:hypothetical protein